MIKYSSSDIANGETLIRLSDHKAAMQELMDCLGNFAEPIQILLIWMLDLSVRSNVPIGAIKQLRSCCAKAGDLLTYLEEHDYETPS